MKKDNQKSQIVIYKAENGQVKIDVRFEDETVWLTQKQMAELFDKDALQLPNIYKMYLERASWMKKWYVGISDEPLNYRGFLDSSKIVIMY